MWGDESEAVAPIIWLYQIVDAQKEEVFFPDLLITLRSYGLSINAQKHDDVIKWKNFPRYWPFVRGTGSRWIPRTKASDAELSCFLWSAPE